jgi:hypothetical protein
MSLLECFGNHRIGQHGQDGAVGQQALTKLLGQITQPTLQNRAIGTEALVNLFVVPFAEVPRNLTQMFPAPHSASLDPFSDHFPCEQRVVGCHLLPPGRG